ncbi:heterocyst differentiation protein HetZ [Leptolyngbya sp. FACHB-711]|uniref:heterocyst differentiation protein HetZ n=1 Tax=unclassified Leptolyngbya TaxID=2650499 RepID=UPI0016850B8E|nr:heterocyst differentiation protein HetZ [Leptolyngbya sp. FACHB-711]MBD1849181.1 heterocyst differentiation protein HetZ [Cyanobacteria bacterium FACHB-502]MBD2024933.1 heterocyst differentiation protein HetZ [Leptolyngbya sp. FACHB-711]
MHKLQCANVVSIFQREKPSSCVEAIFKILFQELQQSTRSPAAQCRAVADRLTEEVSRICSESQRIQASGEVETWSTTLAKHRLKQCLKYYDLGSHRGRIELHSTLSAVVYRYITPPQVQSSYQARLTLIEDFLQGFYIESLNAFRRENQLPATYRPRTLLELAEYMAFTERYGKRRIPLPGRRSQQLIILRAQTFSQQQPPETMVDMEQAAEGTLNESDTSRSTVSMPQVREQMVAQEPELQEDTLRNTVIAELMNYLEERQQQDCADYFALRLKDLPTSEIEAILGLTARQRDYLQQRFKYHLIRFALSHQWELVHQWLEADLERNFGLTPQQWQQFADRLTPRQQELLSRKQAGMADASIAQALSITPTQLQKQWSKLLEQAWEIRNNLISGAGTSTNE